MAVLAVGCVEKGMFDNIHIRPTTTLPVGSIEASDSSLFELAGIQESMVKGTDGVLTFVDSSDLTLAASEIGVAPVTFDEQLFDFDASLAAFRSGDGFVEIPSGQLTETFELSGLEADVTLDTVIFEGGTFRVSVDGLEGVAGYDKSELRVVVPSLLRDERPVVLTPGEVLNLTPDYVLVPEAGNRIRIAFEGRVPQMNTLVGTVEMRGCETEYIAGFFGRRELSRVERTIRATGFGDFIKDAEYVRFDRPELKVELRNAYNAPMLAVVESLRVDGREIDLKEGQDGRLLYIAPRAVSELVVNNESTLSGTGLTDLFTKDFSELSLVVNTILNPTAQDLQQSDYQASDHNSMVVDDTLGGMFAMRLPLDGVLDRVSFEQELEVDLGDLNKEDLDYEKLTFMLSGTNTMPIDWSISVSVREQGSWRQVSLFDDPVEFPSSQNNLPPDDPAFRPGVVDQSNLIVRSLSAEQIDLLLNARKLYLKLTATTLGASERQAVKIYTPSELDLSIVVGAELDFTLNEK